MLSFIMTVLSKQGEGASKTSPLLTFACPSNSPQFENVEVLELHLRTNTHTNNLLTHHAGSNTVIKHRKV